MTATKKVTVAEYQALQTAIPKFLPNYVFFIGGQSYTATEVLTIVSTMIGASTTVVSTKTAAHDALVAEAKTEVQYGPFVKELRQVIGVAFSNATSTLAEFSIPPKKTRAPLSTTARAAAEAKAKATRAARGTKGSKQKAAITGAVTGVTITPVEASAASSAATTPSASAATPVAPGTVPATAGAATGTIGGAPHS